MFLIFGITISFVLSLFFHWSAFKMLLIGLLLAMYFEICDED